MKVMRSVPTSSGIAPKTAALARRLAAGAHEGALRAPVRAEQEGEERHLLEEADRFEDERQHDAGGGQDRHHRAGDEHGHDEALDELARALLDRNGAPGPDHACGQERQEEQSEDGVAGGPEAAIDLGRGFLFRRRRAEHGVLRQRPRVADEDRPIEIGEAGHLLGEAAGDDAVVELRRDGRPEDEQDECGDRRADRREEAVIVGARMERRGPVGGDREGALAADREGHDRGDKQGEEVGGDHLRGRSGAPARAGAP